MSMYAHKKMKSTPETSLNVLKELVPVLEEQEDYSNDVLFELLKGFAAEKEVKARRRDIKYIKKIFPDTMFRRIKDVGHGGLAPFNPDLFVSEMERAIRNGAIYEKCIKISFFIYKRKLFIHLEKKVCKWKRINPRGS